MDMRFRGAVAAALSIVFGLGVSVSSAHADPVRVGNFPADTLRIMVPSAPGGGWDGTGRAIQNALQSDDIAAVGIDVFNVPGAGGTVGLAQLVNERPDGRTVMMTGLTMVGAAVANEAPVQVNEAVPIARVMGEYLAIVVAESSPLQTMEDLLEAFTSSPGSFSWGGGGGGGQDHTLIGLLAREAGVPFSSLNYVAFNGGESRAAIMGNHVSAGATAYSEAKADADSGLVRILAVSSPERIPGTDYPTLIETGLDVQLINWRGLMGVPGMPEEAREAWIEMIGRLQDSPTWQETVRTQGWTEAFLFGDEFESFIEEENARITDLFHELGLIQ